MSETANGKPSELPPWFKFRGSIFQSPAFRLAAVDPECARALLGLMAMTWADGEIRLPAPSLATVLGTTQAAIQRLIEVGALEADLVSVRLHWMLEARDEALSLSRAQALRGRQGGRPKSTGLAAAKPRKSRGKAKRREEKREEESTDSSSPRSSNPPQEVPNCDSASGAHRGGNRATRAWDEVWAKKNPGDKFGWTVKEAASASNALAKLAEGDLDDFKRRASRLLYSNDDWLAGKRTPSWLVREWNRWPKDPPPVPESERLVPDPRFERLRLPRNIVLDAGNGSAKP